MAISTKPEFAEPQGRDFSKLETLYRIYARYAFGLAFHTFPDSDLAENIVHEAFLRFWTNKDHLSNLKGSAFFGWLLHEVQQICQERKA